MVGKGASAGSPCLQTFVGSAHTKSHTKGGAFVVVTVVIDVHT